MLDFMRITSALVDYNNPNSLSARLRRRRLTAALSMIRACHAERGECRVLDIGGSIGYWASVPDSFFDANHCEVTIINLEQMGYPPRRRFTEVSGDACSLQYDIGAFDIGHSNSTIEHVGDWSRMEAFAKEMRRVAKGYFVQTPNFWFPIEPHYVTPGFQFLPTQVQAAIFLRLPLGRMPRPASIAEAMRTVQGISLLTSSMMKTLFPDADIQYERMLGLRKSIIAVRA